MRVSGPLQGAIIALVLGALLRDVPEGAATSLWPYLLGGYALLACVAPWLAGNYLKSDFGLRKSLVLGVLFGLPMAIAAYWLLPSAYRAIGIGCLALTAAWGLHLLTALLTGSRQ